MRRESLLDAIDAGAAALIVESPAFTRRNLFHVVRRDHPRVTEAAFEAALDRRLARERIRGLVAPARTFREPRDFPRAILLVDRPALAHLFFACGVQPSELAVACIDGTPARVVAWLRRAFAEGRRAVALFAHDSATVVYPFAFEPLATLVARSDEPIAYVDLGLPPLGSSPRRFGCAALRDAPIRELEELPPMALIRHCAHAARVLVAEDDQRDHRRARSR